MPPFVVCIVTMNDIILSLQQWEFLHFLYLSILPGCSSTVYLKQFKNPLVPLYLINYILLFLF